MIRSYLASFNSLTVTDVCLLSVLTCVVYLLANGFTYHLGTTSCLGARPLKDILHEILPDWSKWVYVRDIVISTFFVPLLLVRNKVCFLVELWYGFLLIILIKAISIFFTFIPPSNPDCHEKRYLNHCYHSSTSGHASLTVLLAMLYVQHGVLKKQRQMVFVVVFLYCVLILMTRAHYTVDICQAVVVTLLITLYP
jgi:hypothetical protein